MARIRETLPGSTWTEEFSAKRIKSQVGTSNNALLAMQLATERARARVALGAPVDTGELRDSVEAKAVLRTDDPRVEIKTVVHGGYVEKGTKHMAPNPYIAPVMKTDRATWEADVRATKATLDKKVAAAEKKARTEGER